MAHVDDILNRWQGLANARYGWEKPWRDIARFFLPNEPDVYASGIAGVRKLETQLVTPQSVDRGREVYDTTGMWALNRMATGITSLVTPKNSFWQRLETDALFGGEMSDEEERWYERQRDYLFKVRDDSRSGFRLTNLSSIRSTAAFGTGVFFLKEGFGENGVSSDRLPFRYRPIPLSECFIAVNAEGEPDTLFRRFTMTARAIVQRWGDSAGAKVAGFAKNPNQQDDLVEIIHAVWPRDDRGDFGPTIRSSPWESTHILPNDKIVLDRGGFFSFPYIVDYWYRWNDSPYGESLPMLLLAEVKGLSMMRKHALTSWQQMTRPPVATFGDDMSPRPNLNPGAINPGMLTPGGDLLVKPIITAQMTAQSEQFLETSRGMIRQGLLTDLWQTITDPKMTATQALLKANEKAELLAPVGDSISQGRTVMTQRELQILESKGAWLAGSPLAPPASLAGKEITIKSTSPLDRLRRTDELLGAQQVIEMALMAAQVDQAVLDKVDGDEIVEIAQEVTGAPKRILLSPDKVKERRDARERAQMAQAGMAMAQQGAKAAKDAVDPAIALGQALNQ